MTAEHGNAKSVYLKVIMKTNRIIILLVAVITIYSITVVAIETENRIQIQAGVSIYPDPRTAPRVYVEFPFAVHRSHFSFLPEDSTGQGLLTGIFAEIILTDTLGNPIDSSSTYFLTRAMDSVDAQDEEVRLFNRLSLMIDPGIYSATLTVIDAINKSESSFLYDRLEIDSVVNDRLNLSSLEFAHKITTVGDSLEKGAMRLVKNNREVIPNPMGIYSEADSHIYIYAELYNLLFDSSISDTFMLSYMIFNRDGSLNFNYGQMMQNKPGSSSVITNMLEISDLEPGRYDLKLIVRDFGSEMTDTASGRFMIFSRAGDFPEVVTYRIKHPYDTACIETKVNLVKFLLAPQQLAILETLNDTGKTRFINQFFGDRDPDLSTKENEFLDDTFRRYIYANENFSSLPEVNDGWRTDRGRVLMQYGVWEERDEIMAPSYGKPWEKWTYYSLQGGVIFVFQDIDGYGDYELVHSTASGEIFNSSWQAALKDHGPGLIE